MTRVHHLKKIWIAVATVVVLVGIALGVFLRQMRADEDNSGFKLEPDSTTIKSDDIEMGTLIIGSHLIYFSAYTNEIDEIAKASASTFNQQEIYYKSEFSNGTWYEITSADSIKDISTAGKPVDKSVIESLKMTHHTKSDGKTYDLLNNEVVDIFKINDPFDLKNMEELKPLLTQYELLTQKESLTDDETIYKDLIRDFFNTDVKNQDIEKISSDKEVLESFDKEVLNITLEDVNNFESASNGLNKFLEQIGTEVPKKRKIVSDVMGKDNASIKVYSYSRVYVLLSELLNKCQGAGSGEESEDEESEDEEAEAFGSNTTIIDAIAQSQENILNSLSTQQGKMLTPGETAIDNQKYEIIIQLNLDAAADDFEAESADVEKLMAIMDILEGNMTNAADQLAYILDKLLPAAMNAYKEKLQAGISSEYKNAKKEGASNDALEQYLESDKSTLNGLRMQCESLITSAVDRMSNDEGQAFIIDKINEVSDMSSIIPDDAMANKAEETRKQFQDDLTKMLDKLVGDSKDGSALDALLKKKEDLINKRNQAYDNGNLTEEKKINDLIEDLDRQIDELEQDYLDVLKSDIATESEKAIAKANISASTAGGLAYDMSTDIASDIQDGNLDTVGSGIDALLALIDKAPSAVTGALARIKDALALSSEATDDLKSKVNSAIDEGNKKIAASKSLSTDDINDLLRDILGADFKNLSNDKQAAAVVAIEQYAEVSGNSNALEMAGSLADSMKLKNNPYVFAKYTASYNEFVAVRSLANCMGYRYIFTNGHSIVTIQKKNKFYEFKIGELQVTKPSGESDTLFEAPGLQTWLYIPESYLESEFNSHVEYINKSSVGVLYTYLQDPIITEIYEALLAKGGN